MNYIQHIENSILNAENGISKLSPEILNMNGMSSSKVRHFLNNILNIEDARYLEIGVWLGSTFISAMYKNNPTQSHAIDNFSENFNMPSCRNLFSTFCKIFLKTEKYSFIDNDCFKVDLNEIKLPINIYFYDGNHSAESQEKALTYYDKILDKKFIYIVDDYNYDDVKIGTRNGIKQMNYKICFETILSSKTCDPSGWWNGIYVAVLEKLEK